MALIAASIFIWYAVFYVEAHQNLIIDFFDVGQGDAVFIEAPNNNQVLIDGGPNNAILSKLGEVMPFWDRSIDLLVLTHPHADHLDGLLEVLKRYDVETVLEAGVNHTIPEYEEWHKFLKDKNIKIVIANAGQRIYLSDKTFLDVLAPVDSYKNESPKNIHDSTVVSRLTHGSSTAIFMGDAERKTEYKLLFSGVDLKSDILKAGHHGSKTSTSEEFLKAVSPRFAIISAGKKNRYGHPHQEVVDRLNSFGIKVLRTDQDGDIKFISDGINFKK